MTENGKDCLELPVKLLIEKAIKQKNVFPNSRETLENIYKLYLIDEASQKKVASIAGKYLLASYSLEYLKELNDLIVKYGIQQLSLFDFENEETIEKVKKDLVAVKEKPFMTWLEETCLEDLKKICDETNINDLESLNKLGHIVKLSLNEFKTNKDIQDIDLYDVHYRFQTRLDNFNVKKPNIGIFYRFIENTFNQYMKSYKLVKEINQNPEMMVFETKKPIRKISNTTSEKLENECE